MRALVIADAFGIENLCWQERPSPLPGPGQVIVRITAVSFNFRDLQVIGGVRDVPRPLIPLSDACGVVSAIGEGVVRWKLGDRVMPVFAPGWISGPLPQVETLPTLGGPLDGTFREEAAWHEQDLVAVPAVLSDAEAATLPCAAVSAWNALFVAAQTKPGDVVLIQGTGGVALFALQFAKRAGARTILISSEDRKLERARPLGADICINYQSTPKWGAEARRLAGPVDLVVEVGGSQTLDQSLICVRNGGRISAVGFLSGAVAQCNMGEVSRKSIGLQGIRVGNRDSFEALCRVIESEGIRPVVDRVAPIEEAIPTLASYRDHGAFGKICLAFGSDTAST